MSENVAVLGLGNMGQAIAERLLDAGHRLTVWNRSPGKAEPLTARGAREARDIDDAVSGADVVITSLAGDDAVRAVLLPGGAARPSVIGTVVECSTVSPATSAALDAYYPERFVACPIAGAPPMVRAGQALLITAGSPAARKSADAVLADLSQKSHDAGDDPARAAMVKLLNNYLLLGGLALLADVVAAAQANGFDNDYLRELLGTLPVIAPGLRNRVDALIDSRHEPAFSIDLGAKDLRLVDEAFDRQLRLVDAVRAEYLAASRQGLGDRDISAVIEPLRD